MSGGDPDTLTWKKSAASGGGNCVEVASVDNVVLVRDSKDPQRNRLSFSTSEWASFLAGVRAGNFDLRH